MTRAAAITLLITLAMGWLSFVSIMSIGNTSEIRVNYTKIESIFKDINHIKKTLTSIEHLLRDKL